MKCNKQQDLHVVGRSNSITNVNILRLNVFIWTHTHLMIVFLDDCALLVMCFVMCTTNVVLCFVLMKLKLQVICSQTNCAKMDLIFKWIDWNASCQGVELVDRAQDIRFFSIEKLLTLWRWQIGLSGCLDLGLSTEKIETRILFFQMDGLTHSFVFDVVVLELLQIKWHAISTI